MQSNILKKMVNVDYFYMGKGYLIGNVEKRNVHIGNQSTGRMENDIYLNVMVMAENK